MDARFSAEQKVLADSVVAVTSRLGPKTVRDLDDRDRVAKLDAAVEASGWRDLRSDTGSGSPMASAVEAAIIAEKLSAGLADVSFIGPVMASDLRRLAGLAASSSRETVVIDGRAMDAQGCAFGLSLAKTQLARAALDPDSASSDLTRRTAAVSGATTEIGVLDLAGEKSWTALGLALTSADLVGIMTGAVALASEYARSRRQFGAEIGTFQAVQHLLADAHVAAEGSRSVALHAAWAVDALPPPDALAAASVAKAYCSRSARFVCEAAIQVHGGIGNTWECLAHLFLRRALVSIDLFGGIGPNLGRVLEHAIAGGPDGLR